MNRRMEHPPNLTVLLDGSPADKDYREVKQHAESCAQCREEIRGWKSLDEMVRLPELEIEVPPFQWQRIQSRLAASTPMAGGWNNLFAWARPRPMAWKAAVAVMAMCLAALFSWQYHNNKVDQANRLKALAIFIQSESLRLSAAKNPFGAFAESAIANPFDQFEAKISGKNPFEARWQNN
jgi:hypothetical protein